MKLLVAILLITIQFGARADEKVTISSVLDTYHEAASKAQGKRYFDTLDEEGVFMGTDGSERWSKSTFKQFAMPYFSKGQGWTYTVKKRHINVIKGTEVAFFDELLENDFYGLCRSSGLLIKRQGQWKILQFNLSVMVPNEKAAQVVKYIGYGKK